MNYSCFIFHVGNKDWLKPGQNTDGIFEGANPFLFNLSIDIRQMKVTVAKIKNRYFFTRSFRAAIQIANNSSIASFAKY